MRENWKNFKFRWTDLLETHPKTATVNVKIYQKNHRFFVHEEDLEVTDGRVWHGIVHDFTYVIVIKRIERRETAPRTYHLDIKVYLTFDFNPKHLPKISESWGEYVREAIEVYLHSPKILP